MDERYDNNRAALALRDRRELARHEQRMTQVAQVAMEGLRQESLVYRETARRVLEDLQYVAYYKQLYFGHSLPGELAEWLPSVTQAHLTRMAQIPEAFSRKVLTVLERMPEQPGDARIIGEVKDYFRGLLPPG